MARRTLVLVSVILVAGSSACSYSGEFPGTTTTTAQAPTTTAAVNTTALARTTTQPAEPVRVAVIGDFGTGSSEQYEVAALIEAMAADDPIAALVTTGDNFYSDNVEVIWLDPYGWVDETGVPIHAAWGNHDIETRSRVELVAKHLRPPYWWYATELGEATLVVIDSNRVEDEEQLAWLEETLRASEGLVIVAFHHPAFACGTHGSTQSVIDTWVPLFEQYGVDLVLNGHEHSYERFGIAGVSYLVTGGAGQGLRDIGTCPAGTPGSLSWDDDRHHYVLLEIGTDEIEVTTIAVGGDDPRPDGDRRSLNDRFADR